MTDSVRLSGPRPLGVVLFLLLATVAFAQAPLIGEIRFHGELPFSEAKARSLAALRVGWGFEPAKAQAAADRLRDACRNRDRPLATVTWRAEPPKERRGVIVHFDVMAGPRGRLREVRFAGRESISAAALQSALAVLPPTGGIREYMTGRGALQVEKLIQDRQALLNRYRQFGHADAEIGPAELEWVKALGGFRVTWPIIREGPVYTLGFIRFATGALPAPKLLDSIIRLNAGDRYDPFKVESARQRLEEHYRDQGHAFASVRIEAARNAGAARIDLLISILPGLKPRLHAVRVGGNEKTDDLIIRREISLQTGDVFDHAALQLAQARLAGLPMFSDVKIDYLGGPESTDFDLDVKVRERKTGRFEMGYVYGEMEGGAVQLNILEDNLALTPPFRGRAYQGRLGTTVGSNIMRFEAGVFNPRTRLSYWNTDVSVFYEDNEYISEWYNQLSMGGSLMAGHPLGRRHMVSTGYAYTDYDLYDMDPEYEASLATPETDIRLTSWVLAWTMDHTDRAFRPTRGVRARANLQFGNRALGGDTDVIQTHAEATFYTSPYGEHVISLRAAMRSVDPYGDTETVAMPLRLYLGGANNLRGFEYRSVSPQDEESRLVGGESIWWATLEYLLPVHRRIDVALYYDVGDVAGSAYEFSGEGPVSNWGIGLLLRAENFPVRFDVAIPIETLDGDLNNEVGKPNLSFSAGYRF